jgi:ribosomal 50S subunit-associated protein YjgA (DUF615 family)
MPFPNDTTQFKEGESGNPAGRPKGTRNLSTILREMLEEEIEVNVEGKKERKQFQEVIIRKLIKKASDGDIKAITEILDRVEGKAKQTVEQSGKTEQELTVRILDGDTSK